MNEFLAITCSFWEVERWNVMYTYLLCLSSLKKCRKAGILCSNEYSSRISLHCDQYPIHFSSPLAHYTFRKGNHYGIQCAKAKIVAVADHSSACPASGRRSSDEIGRASCRERV